MPHIVALAIVAEGLLLVTRRRSTPQFNMLGGPVDSGESEIDALERHLKADLSCALERDGLRLVARFDNVTTDSLSHQLVSLFHGRNLGDIRLAPELEETKWFDLIHDDYYELDPVIVNYLLPALEDASLI